MKTLKTTMANNIGQVKIEDAQKEIERMNKQYKKGRIWRTDNSDEMFVEDETDDNMSNPCNLLKGYVWITCEPVKEEFVSSQIIQKWCVENIETNPVFVANHKNIYVIANLIKNEFNSQNQASNINEAMIFLGYKDFEIRTNDVAYIKFLDLRIMLCSNNDGIVLLGQVGKFHKGYESHLGNYGDVDSAKQAAIKYFMIARPEIFATMIYRRTCNSYGYHDYFIFADCLQAESIAMPEEIKPSNDINLTLTFKGDKI